MGDVIHLKINKLKWNVQDIAFLYPPDVFTGAFDNEVMEARHREEMQKKLENLKSSIAAEDDPFVAMQLLHKKDHLQFLRNNIDAFRQAEKLEQAVITLYTQWNTPFSSDGDQYLWNELFEACDKKRLYDSGAPIAFSSATIYRGSISGFQRSLIWTPDKATVERIAKRWEDPNLGGGHLFEVDVKKEDVLLFLKLRRGDEVIVSPQFIKTAKIRKYGSDM
ncbi:hypothetical protein [Desulfopila aestuarii]|uniref:Uncharacterized protein n=1 Tax=Desulfopila aestuarii DSM 18488 TaxID=1121416 RepID=A0A1M7YHE4_9BACT|nr:hypothetical protein [Desulfopila aestuarii]SHO51938.1 hypothetical protein SAMN02745220_04289 [Desulfopila aestuarii DSM 18488]